uniref:Uncharacterized protein n=1 Tax=Anguilla anguilla TaxID=7936 RepID=A0A0E9PN89_ANGAN
MLLAVARKLGTKAVFISKINFFWNKCLGGPNPVSR